MSGQRQVRQKANDNLNASGDNLDSTCVVCFKNVEIYSIGECDHPVCYECSTRMRVLCQQNECPICRQGLSKVIFTSEKKSYRELEATNRSEYYNKKYKICFASIQIQKAFYELLDHPCPKCEDRSFSSFDTLKDHVRKEHELFYCDICTENLKIFSFERKCYNRQELGLHRRKGDPDNTSHRGHPLCEYCDCRYLDRDELFRHLRREHYFCHFCDADGANHFYSNVEALRGHFRDEHFLCEEGDCAREQFTAVFRTEIDFKAHIANVHGKSMGKLQAKQARTLQLEITLGPRGRGQQEHTSAHLRSRGNNDYADEPQYTQSAPVQNARVIDARNEQEFPSLGGAGASSGVTLVPGATMSIRAKAFGPAGLARTKENFPALGNSGNSKSDTGPSLQNNSKLGKPVSAILKNQNMAHKPNVHVIHVSNRPNMSTKQPPNQKDFPALPGSSRSQNNVNHTLPQSSSALGLNQIANKQRTQASEQSKSQVKFSQKENKHAKRMEEDFIPSNSAINLNAVSAKHRSLVDDYVSVVQPNSKIALVQKEEAKQTKKDNVDAPVRLDTRDFPALGGSTPLSESLWVKSQKQQDRDNRKSKVAPPPLLPSNSESFNPRKNEKKDKKKTLEAENQGGSQKEKKQNKTAERKQNDMKKSENTSNKANDTKQNTKQAKEKKSPDNNNEIKTMNKNKTKDRESNVIDLGNHNDLGSIGYSSSSSSIMSAPPGFDSKVNETKQSAPPGFKRKF